MASGLKQRANTNGSAKSPPKPDPPQTQNGGHPMGAPKHGGPMESLRILGFAAYFLTSCLFIHGAQILFAPLYLFSKELFYAAMAVPKQYFGLLVTTMTQWWSPTIVRISGDKSVKGLLKRNRDGTLSVKFGERAIFMANHQIYTDWLYLWWIAYTNSAPMHGQIYIILKESLKWVPVIGPAMQLFGFIFMARKWASDEKRIQYRLRKLNSRNSGPGGNELDPMWLLIFPEGTNLSNNGRASSAKYATKSGIDDMRHQLLPRSTGLACCLRELRDTVPYLYDCTIAYEGIPPGQFGQDIFTLRSVYFQGRPPPSVNMHWRRFAVADIPMDDPDAMYAWALARWREKDELIEGFVRDGRFPAEEGVVQVWGQRFEQAYAAKYIDTEVKPRSRFEFLQIFAPVLGVTLIGLLWVTVLDQRLGTEPWFDWFSA